MIYFLIYNQIILTTIQKKEILAMQTDAARGHLSESERLIFIRNIAEAVNGTLSSAIGVLTGTALGALAGFTYAKLADLPANQAAKAWAVWFAAEGSLMMIASALIKGPVAKRFVMTAISGISTAVGIHELQKRNLIGQKMVIFLVISQVIGVVRFLKSMKQNDNT